VAISCVVLPACVRAAQAADSPARSAGDRRSRSDRRDDARESARQILKDTGLTGGVIVHLGCGDGRLTAALGADDRFLVQGLDADTGDVAAAREHVRSLGLYGQVSVEQCSGERLPYCDNLVNLVVVEDLGDVSMDEVMRVLAPLGVACVKRGGRRTREVKPWPAEIDEWQQHFHDADNNAVADDRVVGPPRHYQWIAQPQWTRSHLTLPSITSFVSSRGRLFTVEDQGSAEHPALPGKFALVARDAFNGTVLWQRGFPDWHPVNVYIKFTPAQLQRRLAAVGDTVYCTPGWSAPVTALDAATGKVLKEYAGTERTQEFAFDRGVLYLVIGDPTDTQGIGDPRGGLGSSQFSTRDYGPLVPKLENPVSSIAAIDAESGERLWEKSGDDTAGYQGTSLAVRGDHAVYHTADALVCLDRATGRRLWRVPITYNKPKQPGMSASLVLSDAAVYLADAKSLTAYSLEDGAKMWTAGAKLNHFKAPDVFLAAGVVWSSYYNGHDPQTGEVVKTLTQQMMGPMGHDRCYRNRITERYYINTKTGGSDFLGLETGVEFPHPWARSTCGIGHLPCNGLLYLGPPACSCCNWVMLNSLNALAPEPGLRSSAEPIQVETRPQLEEGPAYLQRFKLDAPLSTPSDWPTYRHDGGRSGVTQAKAPAKLAPRWETKVSTRASAPVVAAGKVFVADVDAHAVCALDASDGSLLWTYTTGARVDSPPTYHQGLLLFGSRDGWVYCVRASDGELAWRFRGLPRRMICAYGQLESVWPVCGSILVRDDVAYFAAGRNSFLDGGIFLYGLDPKTGRVIHHRRMYGPYGEDGFPIITSNLASGNGLDGFKADVFLTDGRLLYLRQQAFQPDLTPLKPEDPRPPHLIPSPGFLEAIPHHRTFWSIDTTIRYDIAASRGAAHGDILVMEGNDFYEVRGYPPGRSANFDPRPSGYTLFAGTFSVTPPKRKEAPAAEASTSKKRRRTSAADPKTTSKKRRQRKPPATVASQRWSTKLPLTGKAMALAGDVLFVAGTPVAFPRNDLARAYEGRMGGVLWAASAETGEKMAEYKLDAPPAWDAMAVARDRLYLALTDGRVICMGED
jgi:outer membrane protein assembly factor BamB/2-polyprenyl-3-methyl-5-hydroxy-6-metoxy-1,4-benzoquinol methylase